MLSSVYLVYCHESLDKCSVSEGPVCGSDGQTYSSAYSFCQINGRNSNVYIARKGPCCSCQNLCYNTLTRGYNSNTKKHVASIRPMPTGFSTEISWRLLCNQQADTVQLYECKFGGGTFISPDSGCEGQESLGSVGYIYTKQVGGTIPLYRCFSSQLNDHMVSKDAGCESPLYRTESLLGYVIPTQQP